MNFNNQFGSNPFSINSTPEPKRKNTKRHPENPPERMRRDIDRFRRMVRPEYSIEDLDIMMYEAERWVGKINRRQRVAAQKRLDALIHACDFSGGDSVADVVAATRGADDRAIREYQLAAVDIALECHAAFTRIVPCTAFHQEQMTDQFYWCNWWASIWQELMREHGDQSPFFFI
jgi:hypothetical protein